MTDDTLAKLQQQAQIHHRSLVYLPYFWGYIEAVKRLTTMVKWYQK